MRGFLPVFLVSLLAGGCNVQVGDNGVSFDVGSRARDEWTRTYTLPEGGRLEIVNVNGEIQASAAEGREVQVRAEREARGGSEDEARALLASLDMREQVAPDSVRIEAVSPSPEGGGRRSFSVSYEVRIPAGLSVTLRTENGRIRLENISGQIQAVTSNGGIDGEGLSGSLSAEVVNGGIEVELASVTGDVTLSSVNGGIEIELPADVRASLEATCVNGGINIDDRLGMTVTETTRRSVTGSLNGGGVKISANTVNGGVRITPRQAS
jgi:hypothetical protein